jgi:hypothetical protein
VVGLGLAPAGELLAATFCGLALILTESLLNEAQQSRPTGGPDPAGESENP